MKKLGLVLIFLNVAGIVVAQEAATSAPAGISLDQVDPDALIRQARAAMLEYLTDRTPAEEQKLLPDLFGLQSIKHGAAVGIRIDGQLKAQAFATSGEFCRNVMAAAIQSLRSPSLPDHVTPDLVQKATIEIESIESLRATSPKDIQANYIQGLLGLMLKTADQEAWSLPSAAYEYNLTAAQALARCQGQLPPSQLPSAQWFAFIGRHYVGYPDGKGIRLYRGKILTAEKTDHDTRLLLAGQIGLYVQSHQAKDGCFRAAAARGSLVEHLYATFAMARLAIATGQRLDAANALKYARTFVQKSGDLTFLASEQPADQLLAAALYILASEEAGLKTDDLRDELVKTIAARMELPALPARLDAGSTQGAPQVALYVASRAMAGKPPKAAKLLRDRAQSTEPDSLIAALWKSWSGLAVEPPNLSIFTKGMADELGGAYDPKSKSQQTIFSALGAMALATRIEAPSTRPAPVTGPATMPGPAAVQLEGLWAFCQRMTYKPNEACFAPDPSDWVGAVRTYPPSAQVDLASCAATIECLLLP